MAEDNLFVIVTGTDPTSRKGGIGFALPGYLTALERAGLDFKSIPTYHPSTCGGSWWPWLCSFRTLRQQLITCHNSGQKVIVYSHAGGGVSILREGILLAFCRLYGAKTVMQLHAVTVDRYLRHKVECFLFSLAISPSSALAILTSWWRDRLVSAQIEKPVYVIPNPLPLPWEKIAKVKLHCKINKEKLVILCLTRIEPGKGVDFLVDAMPLLPKSVRLIVAGDGSQLAMLKEQTKILGVDSRVQFFGWVTGEDKQRLFDEADIFCLPSSYDSFGMGFIEAMANGLPIVALNWGPVRDVVPNERTGILINKDEPEQLVSAIERLRDRALRKQMGEEGKRWVLEQFSTEKIGKDLRKVFDSVLSA